MLQKYHIFGLKEMELFGNCFSQKCLIVLDRDNVVNFILYYLFNTPLTPPLNFESNMILTGILVQAERVLQAFVWDTYIMLVTSHYPDITIFQQKCYIFRIFDITFVFEQPVGVLLIL